MGCVTGIVKTGIIFGSGVYAGVYIAQNYQIDKVEDPMTLFSKAQAAIKEKMDGISGGKKP
ncbi:uncharacterized protein isoform X2 [Choristoneura fumiferana]|uniref:uncharacterized protein isoform X2 n=1 Tax=Choristoneura fumiferana TaxID=7141 RepID=UPI003D156CBF